jgi:hypothetical protein
MWEENDVPVAGSWIFIGELDKKITCINVHDYSNSGHFLMNIHYSVL